MLCRCWMKTWTVKRLWSIIVFETLTTAVVILVPSRSLSQWQSLFNIIVVAYHHLDYDFILVASTAVRSALKWWCRSVKRYIAAALKVYIWSGKQCNLMNLADASVANCVNKVSLQYDVCIIFERPSLTVIRDVFQVCLEIWTIWLLYCELHFELWWDYNTYTNVYCMCSCEI